MDARRDCSGGAGAVGGLLWINQATLDNHTTWAQKEEMGNGVGSASNIVRALRMHSSFSRVSDFHVR